MMVMVKMMIIVKKDNDDNNSDNNTYIYKYSRTFSGTSGSAYLSIHSRAAYRIQANCFYCQFSRI